MHSNFNCRRLIPADLPPVAGKDGLLPSLPPRCIDSGHLLERPVFAGLWPVFDNWRKRMTTAPGTAPMVFCICGRDGDGKSALLLQLAAALLRGQAISARRCGNQRHAQRLKVFRDEVRVAASRMR